MIERFGTGIRRICDEYQGSIVKPSFDISENAIRIVLPVLQEENIRNPDDRQVYQLFKNR